MVDHYLGDITVSWFNQHDMPPSHVKDYHSLVLWMRQNANNHGDLNYLKLAFEYMLIQTGINYEEFAGGRYPYDGEDIREIIEFSYKMLWPDSNLPEQLPDVRLVDISLEEWWEKRPILPDTSLSDSDG
ncbi:hypothetical protein C7B61_00130 [filamentous cyanobacterium CCP1]|nr:hypothetical protein C7B61_00130 [filamentous cyanobacterium CCP1]